jgi:aerobic-type carbon monoxide dehydrogenase small subunit (CoxS/CutS family)
MSQMRVQVQVNGAERDFDVQPHHTLLDTLRDELGLTGSKACCLVGECGACTILLDGQVVDSCLVLAAEVDGSSVTTVEGLASGGRLSAIQQAFLDTGAVQCGFCIPGQLMAATALLQATPNPTRPEIEEGLAGNYCRCAGYEQIIEAVEMAAHGAIKPDRGATAGSDLQAAAGDEPTPADPTDVAGRPDATVAPQ